MNATTRTDVRSVVAVEEAHGVPVGVRRPDGVKRVIRTVAEYDQTYANEGRNQR